MGVACCINHLAPDLSMNTEIPKQEVYARCRVHIYGQWCLGLSFMRIKSVFFTVMPLSVAMLPEWVCSFPDFLFLSGHTLLVHYYFIFFFFDLVTYLSLCYFWYNNLQSTNEQWLTEQTQPPLHLGTLSVDIAPTFSWSVVGCCLLSWEGEKGEEACLGISKSSSFSTKNSISFKIWRSIYWVYSIPKCSNH